MNFVPCLTWVQRGVAKSVPEKVQLSKEELKKLIEESITDIQDLKVENDDDEEEEGSSIPETEKESGVEQADSKMDVELVAKYNLDSYEEDSAPSYVHLGQLAEISDNEDDEKDTNHEEDSEDEENFKIRQDDNLIAVGHVCEDCSTLEVYVYNEEDGDLYVHHDIILPAFPICLEWLSYGPDEERPSNYLAIGDMTPVINIWDLDMVDIMEPIAKLGKKLRKKDKKKIPKGTSGEHGHGDAVLDLSWNKHLGHALASGSADCTTILWDLSTAAPVTWLKDHTEKVQCVEWHPFEAELLLTGSSDKRVLLYDARTIEVKQSWTLDEEVERIVWNHFDPFTFLAGTDAGNILCFDIRQKVPLYTIDAHAKSISDMSLSPSCPGLLVSTGCFTSLKIWDIRNNQPQLVKSQKLKEGNLLACRLSPNSPFTVAVGGDKPSANFKVLNTLNMEAVRSHFVPDSTGSIHIKQENLEFDSESDVASSSQFSVASSSQLSVTSSSPEKLKTGKVLKKTLSKKKWK